MMVVTQLATSDLGEDTFRVVIESPIPLEMFESLQVTQPAWIGCSRGRPPVASSEKEARSEVTAAGDDGGHIQPAAAKEEDMDMSPSSQQGTTQEQDDPGQDVCVGSSRNLPSGGWRPLRPMAARFHSGGGRWRRSQQKTAQVGKRAAARRPS